LACANRHRIDHDRASDGLWTRLDVTVGLWKFLERLFRRSPTLSQRTRRDGHQRAGQVTVVLGAISRTHAISAERSALATTAPRPVAADNSGRLKGFRRRSGRDISFRVQSWARLQWFPVSRYHLLDAESEPAYPQKTSARLFSLPRYPLFTGADGCMESYGGLGEKPSQSTRVSKLELTLLLVL